MPDEPIEIRLDNKAVEEALLEVAKKASDLVQQFNQETKDGNDMATYSRLLKSAIENIVGKKEEAGINSLFSQGGTNFYKTSSSSNSEDFELVSFLIIK